MSSKVDNFYYKIGEGAYLDSESEVKHNVQRVHTILTGLGFTSEAACGIIGNMYIESTMNPGQQTGNAWGLTQFYPYTRLTSYCEREGYANWYSGFAQCKLINDEGYFTDTSGDFERQWLPVSGTDYTLTWDEYKALTDVRFAAKCYMYQNERPGTDTSEARADQAEYWYNWLQDHPSPSPSYLGRKLPLFMMCNMCHFYVNRRRF